MQPSAPHDPRPPDESSDPGAPVWTAERPPNAGGRQTGWRARLDGLLAAWFLGWSAVRIWQLGATPGGFDLSWLGRDFRIYRNAAIALLEGSDPYAAFDVWNGRPWHFAAPPTAAQLFVPFALLPETLGLAIFLGLAVAITMLALRQLGLAWWWLLFPPMAEGLLAANPHVLVLPMLVLGGAAADAVAGGLKIYAAVPLVAERRWRGLLALAGLLGLSVLVSPAAWAAYLRDFAETSARLAAEAEGGVSAALLLDPAVFGSLAGGTIARVAGLALFALIGGLVALASVRDVRAAGWIAVPLLWPASQYPYATFILPVARRLSSWMIAIPTIPTYLLGLLILSYEVTSNRPAIAPQGPPIGLRDWVRTVHHPSPSTRGPVP